MSKLHEKKCIPCSGEVPPLKLEEIRELKSQISSEWQLIDNNTKLFRNITFNNFKKPMDLAIKIGEIAEEQWHHPELSIGWGHLDIKLWTHKINALVESDFIFASKIDKLL